MGLFGSSKPDPKQLVEEWRKQLRTEIRSLDRQVTRIEREEMKVKISLKDAAKKNQIDVAKVLAKSILHSRKAKNRIHAAKAQINSVIMEMRHQLAMVKMGQSIQQSTKVMEAMSSLLKVQEIHETMAQLSQEMNKAGLIEEVMEDSLESVLDDEDLDEEADSEVNKVLHELTSGLLGEVPSHSVESAAQTPIADEELDTEADDLLARMQALSS
eukprot:gene4840-6873_t